ncbi:hypothetical protein YC2023_060879 [Brassica napus]
MCDYESLQLGRGPENKILQGFFCWDGSTRIRSLLVQGSVRLNRWRCQIEIDSGWKHVCFEFSAWDSVVVCFGFSGI